MYILSNQDRNSNVACLSPFPLELLHALLCLSKFLLTHMLCVWHLFQTRWHYFMLMIQNHLSWNHLNHRNCQMLQNYSFFPWKSVVKTLVSTPLTAWDLYFSFPVPPAFCLPSIFTDHILPLLIHPKVRLPRVPKLPPHSSHTSAEIWGNKIKLFLILTAPHISKFCLSHDL